MPGLLIASDSELGIVRSAEVKSMLARESAKIGENARGMVLFHESSFDAAQISLDPCVRRGADVIPSEMAEANTSPLAMLYLVLEAEEGKVEFEIQSAGHDSKRLSKGGEALVPPGMRYALRNHSTSKPAMLMAVVPLAT